MMQKMMTTGFQATNFGLAIVEINKMVIISNLLFHFLVTHH